MKAFDIIIVHPEARAVMPAVNGSIARQPCHDGISSVSADYHLGRQSSLIGSHINFMSDLTHRRYRTAFKHIAYPLRLNLAQQKVIKILARKDTAIGHLPLTPEGNIHACNIG